MNNDRSPQWSRTRRIMRLSDGCWGRIYRRSPENGSSSVFAHERSPACCRAELQHSPGKETAAQSITRGGAVGYSTTGPAQRIR